MEKRTVYSQQPVQEVYLFQHYTQQKLFKVKVDKIHKILYKNTYSRLYCRIEQDLTYFLLGGTDISQLRKFSLCFNIATSL